MKAKRLLASVLAFVLCFSMLPTSAFAAIEFDSTVSNDYYTVISNKEYALAPGVTESEIIVNNKEGSDRKIVHVFEVDSKNETVKVLPGYYGIDKLDPDNLALDGVTDKTVYWTDKKLTETVAYYENQLGYNVVGAMNTALAYDSNAPYGYMVWDGVVLGTPEVHSGAQTYLAIYKDGTAELRDMKTPLDGNEWTAISANFGWLVKNGVLTSKSVERTSSDASRSMIGIKADGTLVFCQVDGRNAPTSTGLSNYEMGEMMLSLGCVNAVNCDGGGSSTFVSKRAGESENTMRSIPSDGAERPTINSVIIATTAIPTGIFDHAIVESGYDYYAAGSTGAFSMVGLDSAGYVAELPEDIMFELSDASFGEMVDNVFVSNGQIGDVSVQAVYNGKVVGSKVIHVVHPDKFALELDETVLPYGKSMTIEFNCVYGADNWAVCMDDAVTLSLSDEWGGWIDGNVLTATEDESIAGVEVIASYNADPSVSDTMKVTFGKGSEILFDFEDGDISGFLGVDEMYDWAEEVGAAAPIQGDGNYSENTDSETFLSTDVVRNGDYALGVTLDYTNADFAGWSYNMFFYTGESEIVLRDVANGMNATTFGMWVYIPEGAAGLAMQIQGFKNPNGTEGTGGHFYFTTVNGAVKNLNSCTEADIPESRWVYATCDLTQFGDFFATYDPYGTNGREPSFIRYYVKPMTASTLTFYFDDFTLDYSSAVDDRILPTINNVSYTTQDESVALNEGAVINGNSISFSAVVADNIKLDNATGCIYVDGNALPNVAVSGKYLTTTSNVVLNPGAHTVAFEIKDTMGNAAKVTRNFVVAGEAEVELGGHNDSGLMPEYGSVYYVDVNVKDINKVEKLSVTLGLQTANTWEPEGISAAKGFDVTYELNEVEQILTIHVERNGAPIDENAVTLVSAPVRLWTWTGINHVTDTEITPESQYKTGYCPVVKVDCKVLQGLLNDEAMFGGKISVETKINDIVYPWHYHDENLTVLEKDATCHENGYTDRTYCEACQSVIDWGTTLDAGHGEYVTEDKDATCTEDGYIGRTFCVDCGDVIDAGTVVPAGHVASAMVEYKVMCHCGAAMDITGLVQIDGFYYYAISGNIVNGWHNIDGAWHYFRSSTRRAAVGTVRHQYGSVMLDFTYSDDNTGRLTTGVWVELEKGIRYYYGPGYYSYTWATIDGDSYYFDPSGYRYSGYHLIKDSRYSHDDDYKLYRFAEDGKLLETSSGNGLFVTEDATYYLENGYAKYKGLMLIDGDYYYFGSNHVAVTGPHYVDKTNGLLPAGTYTFGADGKMIKLNGIVGDYYYIDGVIQKVGLTKVGNDYYYFSTTNGKMRRSQTSQVNIVAPGCDLPFGVYTFGADGKVVIENLDGIIGDYYYIDGVIQKTGLTKVGDAYYYFSTTNGKMRRSQTSQVNIVAPGCDLPVGVYTFGADGKVVIEKKNGIIGDYYYIDGVIQMTGLTKVGNDYYYFSTTNGKMRRSQTSMVNYVAPDCDLPVGVYTFGADGKVIIELKNGIIGDYYYINGVVQMTGLIKIGDDYYYFSTTNGKMRRSQTSQVNIVAPGCDLPVGVYTFGADGKVIFD